MSPRYTVDTKELLQRYRSSGGIHRPSVRQGRRESVMSSHFSAQASRRESTVEFGVNSIYLSHLRFPMSREQIYIQHADAGAFGFAGADNKRCTYGDRDSLKGP